MKFTQKLLSFILSLAIVLCCSGISSAADLKKLPMTAGKESLTGNQSKAADFSSKANSYESEEREILDFDESGCFRIIPEFNEYGSASYIVRFIVPEDGYYQFSRNTVPDENVIFTSYSYFVDTIGVYGEYCGNGLNSYIVEFSAGDMVFFEITIHNNEKYNAALYFEGELCFFAKEVKLSIAEFGNINVNSIDGDEWHKTFSIGFDTPYNEEYTFYFGISSEGPDAAKSADRFGMKEITHTEHETLTREISVRPDRTYWYYAAVYAGNNGDTDPTNLKLVTSGSFYSGIDNAPMLTFGTQKVHNQEHYKYTADCDGVYRFALSSTSLESTACIAYLPENDDDWIRQYSFTANGIQLAAGETVYVVPNVYDNPNPDMISLDVAYSMAISGGNSTCFTGLYAYVPIEYKIMPQSNCSLGVEYYIWKLGEGTFGPYIVYSPTAIDNPTAADWLSGSESLGFVLPKTDGNRAYYRFFIRNNNTGEVYYNTQEDYYEWDSIVFKPFYAEYADELSISNGDDQHPVHWSPTDYASDVWYLTVTPDSSKYYDFNIRGGSISDIAIAENGTISQVTERYECNENSFSTRIYLEAETEYYFVVRSKNTSVEFTAALEITKDDPTYNVIASGYCGADPLSEYDELSGFYKNVKWTAYYNGQLIISGTGPMGNFSEYPLSPRHIFDNYNVKSISIENGITSIGNNAFHGCTSLINVSIPSSVTSIGDLAFACCSSLLNVTIPSNTRSIGEDAFASCSNLVNVVIPNGVTSIGEGAFANCSSLASISIPSSVTNIGYGAFSSCYELKSVTVPNSVTHLGGGTFGGCHSLTDAIIGNRVTTIEDDLFCQCYNLKNVTLPSSIESIGELAFCECKSLENITIPSNVTSIGRLAFNDCSVLTSVVIPDGVTSIGYLAFSECSSLESVTIPSTVKQIGWGAFEYCARLLRVTIPNGVTGIEDSTFWGCKSLEEVSIPNSVESIGEYAFYACHKLEDVYYDGTDAEWLALRENIASGNDSLFNAAIHFSSPEEPEIITTDYITIRKPKIEVGEVTYAVFHPVNTVTDFVTWSSRDRSIATVDANGRVTGIAPGLTYITATTDTGLHYFCSVLVIERAHSTYLNSFAYSFMNTYDSFGYESSYRIPMERYVQAGHGVNAAWLYYDVINTSWTGNCHGMSASSILFYKGILQEEYYDPFAHYPYDFDKPDSYSTKDKDLRYMIELFQAVQNPFNNGSIHWTYNFHKAQSIANELDNGNPVLLSIVCAKGAHAVVVYDYSCSDGIYTFEIYDCSGYVKQLICRDEGINMPFYFVYDNDELDFNRINGYETVSDLQTSYNLMRNNLLYPTSYLSPSMKLMSSANQIEETTLYVTLTKDAVITNSTGKKTALESGELCGEIEGAYANVSDISATRTVFYLTLPIDDYSFSFCDTEDGEINIIVGDSIITANLKGISKLGIDKALSTFSLEAKDDAEFAVANMLENCETYNRLALSGTMGEHLIADLSCKDSVSIIGAKALEATLTISGNEVSVSANNLQEQEAVVKITENIEDKVAAIMIDETPVSTTQVLAKREKTPLPVYDVESGSYEEGHTLTFTKDSDTVIYFTIDGSDPVVGKSMIYGNPIAISKSMTVKAVAVKHGYEISDILSLTYSIMEVEAPISSHASGSYDESFYLTLTSSTDGADIIYSLDGSDPHIYGTEYSGAIYIDEDTTVRAFCIKNGCISDDIMLNYEVSANESLAIINTPTNQNGEVITADNMADLTQINLIVKKCLQSEMTCKVIVAFYDKSNRMLSSIFSASVLDGCENEISVSATQIPTDTSHIKFFLLDSDFAPLGYCYKYNL